MRLRPNILCASAAIAFMAQPVLAQEIVSYAAELPGEETPSHRVETGDIDPKPLSLADLESMAIDKDEKFTGEKKLPFNDSVSTPVEDMYAERAGSDLALFGYDLFGGKAKASDSLPSGSVTDDYILGPGDRIEISIKGQEQARKTYEIDTQGRLITDDFETIAATGRTLRDVRAQLKDDAALRNNVRIDVSMTAPRQIDVLVIGDVAKPGRKTLTPYHTILDALTEAGGVKKTGSLRRIKLVRGGKSVAVDLYTVLMQGGTAADAKLRDGDRIIVPPLGQTVAVSGAVKRPAIYEIRKDESLSAAELLGLAGGLLSPGANRLMRLSVSASGDENVESVTDQSARTFADGSILDVARGEEKRSRNVELSGETRDPGEHPLAKAKTLAALISAQRFGDALYPLLGVIERRDPGTLSRDLIEFSPKAVAQRGTDIPLEEGDKVHLFSVDQIKALSKTLAASEPVLTRSHSEKNALAIDDQEIASFVSERAVFLRGAVRNPGAYPVAKNTALASLVSSAGGFTVEADKSNIELTAQGGGSRRTTGTNREGYAAIRVSPGDTVRVGESFARVEEQSVSLLGEVRNPGRYDLKRGDTLLDLIRRAGGLTSVAYPDGAIFSRLSERKQEESRYKAQARDLEMKLAQSLQQTDKDKKPDMAQVGAAQGLISQLRDAKAVGRITVEADPAILSSDPEQDILLEGGDKIYIPKRPSNVRVGGEVLSPAALQFRRGKSGEDYIEEAGGTTYFADKDRAFVVYPDGSAKPLAVSAWKQSDGMIPPGSAVIVPRDPKPFDFLQSAETISQVFANIALTGFYLDDLHDNDD